MGRRLPPRVGIDNIRFHSMNEIPNTHVLLVTTSFVGNGPFAPRYNVFVFYPPFCIERALTVVGGVDGHTRASW